jgi:predicted nucleic acid-binding protein
LRGSRRLHAWPERLRIAACCVSHGLPLLTRNRKHFEPLEPLGLVLL